MGVSFNHERAAACFASVLLSGALVNHEPDLLAARALRRLATQLPHKIMLTFIRSRFQLSNLCLHGFNW
jgi:hypothetical protein